MQQGEGNALAREWDQLHWWCLPLRLRNVRNDYAKEHPVFVIRALLLYAQHGVSQELRGDWRFSLRHLPGERIKKNALYTLDWLFPFATEEQARAYARALERYLGTDGGRNFVLEGAIMPQRRDMQTLQQKPLLYPSANEICLDFFTPMAFSPSDSKRSWMLTAEQLRGYLHALTHRVAAPLSLPEPPVIEDLELLCWCWEFESHRRTPRSMQGSHSERRVPASGEKRTEILGGMTGPLYLRGHWQAWEPWLRLAAEFGVGKRSSLGQGACALTPVRSTLDRQIGCHTRYLKAWEEYADGLEREDTLVHALADREEHCQEWARSIAAGTWQPLPATECLIPKKDHSFRRICLLSDRDQIIHRTLLTLLDPVIDRALEQASIGYRKGRSVEDAKRAVQEAMAAGCDHVVESDVQDCFDSLPWATMEAAIARVIPLADVKTREVLAKIIRTPVQRDGREVPRSAGILQGSALSPLLANVFLDPLDEAVARRGWHFVRYGDDFILLTCGEEEARRALEFLRETLAAMGLTMKAEKTGIRPVLHGFRFLGMQLGGDLSETFLETTALRRPVIIRTPYCFAGLDHDCLHIKKDKTLLDRIPLLRISQLIFHGTVSFSSKLVEACARRDIPITLCTAAGHHIHTITPDGRSHMERRARHHTAYETIGPQSRLELARQAVAAKCAHHLQWLATHPAQESRQTASFLRHHLRSILVADDLDRLRGLEGTAASAVFPTLRSLILKPDFHSQARVPFHKPDRWNCLLDFAYSQCFAHLNALCRSSGLNPYLGFLHSPQDRFESLVADLQEPFRPRMDRWAIRCINLGIVQAADFSEEQGKWRLVSEAYPKLLESFAKECNTRFGADHATLGEFLHAQVRVFCDWADHGTFPRFWMPTGWDETKLG